MKWTPKAGTTTLDTISQDVWKGFQWALLRNGHVVSLFLSESAAQSKCAERAIALPEDEWSIAQR